MKRCTNPNCESSFLFGNNRTNCPFCHSPLVSVEEAAPVQQLITPIDAAFEDVRSDLPENTPYMEICNCRSTEKVCF